MGEFLDTELLNLSISDTIMNAKTRLIIISPFLKTCDKIRKCIEEADRKGVNSIFV